MNNGKNMNANVNANTNTKPIGTNRIGTTVGIGLAALIIGLMAGAAGAENGCLPRAFAKAVRATNQAPATAQTPLPAGDLANRNPGFQDHPGYALSLEVRDLKNSYQVRADLPDASAADVHVSVKDQQTLDVVVDNHTARIADQKNAETSLSGWGQYEQMIRLPSPVRADQMTIRRAGHELDISVPKAA
jgi:HSP20 family molecular chaperone IbpA